MTDLIKYTTTQPTSWAPYASVTLATLGGFAIAGIPGGLIGFSAAMVDEERILSKQTKNHEASIAIFHYTMTFQPWEKTLSAMFPVYAPLIQEISYVLSSIAPDYTNDFLDLHDKIDVPLDSFLTINKIFDEKEIISTKEANRIYNKFLENPIDGLVAIKEDMVEIYNNQFLSNFITNSATSLGQVVSDKMFLYYMGGYANNIFASALLASHSKTFADPKFFIDSGKIIAFSSIKFFSDMRINAIQNILSKQHHELIISKAADLLLDEGNSRKILGIEKVEGQQIINYLINDLFVLLDGANKLNKVIAGTTGALISLGNLVKFAPEIVLPYITLSMIPKQKYLKKILSESKKIAEDKENAVMSTNNIMMDIIEKSEPITLRDGEKSVKHKFNTQWSKLKELNLNSSIIEKSKGYMYNAMNVHNMFIDAAYFGAKKYYDTSFDVGIIPFIYSSAGDVFFFLSSNLDVQADNIQMLRSKKRVDKLFELINSPVHHAERINNEDGNIIFKNYTIFLGDEKLVGIDNLLFEKGKHYAITGKSGCGKSSVLIDLKEGVVGALSSEGEIHLPLASKIMHLDQQLYIPKESTLLEVMYFPNILDQLSKGAISNLKSFIVNLFQELEIDGFVNDSKSTEGLIANLDTQKFKLSGGQMQKIAIIQAILNKPDIIIMDENFARLDNDSVFKIQQAIDKYLKEATILVVDHKAHSHNYNNFYDAEMHFKNGAVTVDEIAPTPIKSDTVIEIIQFVQDQKEENGYSDEIQVILEFLLERQNLKNNEHTFSGDYTASADY